MKFLILHLVLVSVLNKYVTSKCPSLIINYKETPKFEFNLAFNVFMFKSVDQSIKSPFDIQGHLFDFSDYFNYQLEMSYIKEKKSFIMRIVQFCKYGEQFPEMKFNNITYHQKNGDNRLYLKYDNEDELFYCNAEAEMTEIFIIDSFRLGVELGRN